MKKIRTAEIICVGTELLLGDIVDTNSAFLSKKLAELGISVYHKCVVGDNAQRLSEAVDEALGRSDLVITSGGLGPTYDDLTKEIIAKRLGLELRMNEDVLADIRAYFAETGRTMTENNKKQAMLPTGSVVFKNNYGTAPAVGIEDKKSGASVIMLPGPPRELEPLFTEEVMPYLESRTDSVLVSKNLNIIGMGESAVENALSELMRSSENPTLAPYCGDGEVRLRITAKASDRASAEKMCDETAKKVMETEVGAFVYGTDAGGLEEVLVPLLGEAGLTVATAESCTGGLIAKRITDIAGASRVFVGGAVTYMIRAKEAILGVPSETIEKYGVVSAETAEAMASGARERFGSDIAISTTGIAGPGGGTPETPVGTVWLGISSRFGTRSRLLTLSPRRSRDYLRTTAASNAIAELIAEAKKISKS